MSAKLIVNGAELWADPSGALHWPARETLIVADLHFEKGSALARRGAGPLPPYDTAETLSRLEAVCRAVRPRRVVALGDSLHDRAAATAIDPADRERVRALTATHEWIWIAGNHDPEPPVAWGGTALESLRDGPLSFRHEARAEASEAGELSGHFHPVAVVRTALRRVRGRCFAVDGRRVVLPSFGAYTGGLDVMTPSLRRLFGASFAAYVIGRNRVHPIPASRLARPATS